jgi:class 3 adenylate cyclase/tetratricopeptide (TPR) repeat protein
MFCDLVGSTPLAQRLDPEDVHEVIRAYQAVCDEVIRRYEGHVAAYLGDGLLVYFGYPTAHEDDAQRAVRAGLGIVEALVAQNAELESHRGICLAVRLGIHSGPAVVGGTGAADDASGDTQVIGHTMNLAARLQSVAPVDRVVISQETLHLVRGLFTVRGLGPQVLRGIAEPVDAYEVVRSAGVGAALDASEHLTEMVGRTQELGLLADRFAQVQDGRGQAVVVWAEAGMGKSRVIHALRERLADTPHTWLQCRGSPYHTHSALHPVIELIQRGLFIHERDAAPEREAKLVRALEEAGLEVAEVLPLFAPLLSLPQTDAYTSPALSPDARRQRTLEALARWILAFAEKLPAVAVIEDLHWIDPSTLELIGMIADQAPTTKILIVATARPFASPPWVRRGHVAQLVLGPLSRADVLRVVSSMTRGRSLPDEVIDQLVAKTDGVPIFVEELTKMVLESGLLHERDGGYVLDGPLPPLAIPATLQDSLMARLDRLAPVKRVAQIAAVLGREFSFELLCRVADLDPVTLRDALAKLVDAELLYQRGVGSQAGYTFRHALIQESAYESLLKSTRQRVHERTTRALLQHFPALVDAHPELLAHHFECAGDVAQAVANLELAGERQTARSAYLEAARLLERALDLLRGQQSSAERDAAELSLRMRLAVPLAATRGYASDDLGRLLTRARSLCESLGASEPRFAVVRGQAVFHATRAEYGRAAVFAEECLAMAEATGSPALYLGACVPLIHARFFVADFAGALSACERGLATYVPERDAQLALVLGEDPALVCSAYRPLCLHMLGQPERALAAADHTDALAERLGTPLATVLAGIYRGWLHQMRGEPHLAVAPAARAVAIATEQALHFWRWFASMLSAWAIGAAGDPLPQIDAIRSALTAWQAAGTGCGTSAFLLWTADLLRRAGHLEDALATVRSARAFAEKSGERHVRPEIDRMLADLAVDLS